MKRKECWGAGSERAGEAVSTSVGLRQDSSVSRRQARVPWREFELHKTTEHFHRGGVAGLQLEFWIVWRLSGGAGRACGPL